MALNLYVVDVFLWKISWYLNTYWCIAHDLLIIVVLRSEPRHKTKGVVKEKPEEHQIPIEPYPITFSSHDDDKQLEQAGN